MSEYKWCHGPNCHKRHTTTRVRGVKGNKVLRTVKIRANNWTRDTQWEYFCDQTCLHDFIRKHFQEFVRLHPRTECLETPVNVTKEDNSNQYYNYVRTNIEVDESRNIG
jgi:hypothetical protein